MQALGRWPSLLRHGAPRCGTDGSRHAMAGTVPTISNKVRQNASTVVIDGPEPDRLGHRLEPPLDPAVQRIIVTALVMWLGRLTRHPIRTGGKHRMAPLPVTTAIRHVCIRPQIVPARRERRPVGQWARLLQQGTHVGRVDEAEAVFPDLFSQQPERVHGPPLYQQAPGPWRTT